MNIVDGRIRNRRSNRPTTRPPVSGNARNRAHPAARRGFTLVSMLIALILLGVGVGALANATAETLKSQTIAQNKTNAIAIGRAYVESVRTRDPWQLASEASTRVDGDGTASADGMFNKSLDLRIERQNLLRLTITVNYPRMTTPVVLTTYLFRGNPLAVTGP
jgi:type II secretory pathway pseudopilin PulG